jgi:hypothetical protein
MPPGANDNVTFPGSARVTTALVVPDVPTSVDIP